MMRLLETKAAKEATTAEVDENGIQFKKRILSSTNKDKKQSTEGEMLAAIQRICQKCEQDDKPHKFEKPDNVFHVIIVDMRTFKDGGDIHDRKHIALGGAYVDVPYRAFWTDEEGKSKLISGVFGEGTDLKGAANVRERVHFIGFVRERSFESGEFGKLIEFVANPHFFKAVGPIKTAFDTWPLRPAKVLNGAGQLLPRRVHPLVERDVAWPAMWRIRLPNGDYSDMVNITRANEAAALLSNRVSQIAA